MNEPRDLEEDEDEDAMDVEERERERDEGWRGTVRRQLWKATCTRAALNVRLPPIHTNTNTTANTNTTVCMTACVCARACVRCVRNGR